MKIKQYLNQYKERLNHEMKWDIALRSQQNDNEEWVIVTNESKRYWGADPFLFKHNGTTYLFYECYDRNKEKGCIAYRIVNADLTVSEARVIINEKYHMSFPYIFRYNDNIYVIPETSENKSIQVYKAIDFPDNWELYKTVITDFPAVDTIVLSTGNEIVLHTSLGDACAVENYVLKLDTDFNLKSKKLVCKKSEYGNRNAGKLIERDGVIYRIGQDCRDGDYGKGIVFYKTIDAEGIEEQEAEYLYVSDLNVNETKYSGIHTLNYTDDMAVVDLRYMVKNNILRKIKIILDLGVHYVIRRIKC